MQIRQAKTKDIKNLEKLINHAYRGQHAQSWTTEHGIVDGQRINQQQLLHLIHMDNFQLFVMLNEAEQIVGCIGIEFKGQTCEIGTFAIDPALQAAGLGRQLLEYAEKQAIVLNPNLTQFGMYVIDVRLELIQFYQRCGYQNIQQRENYPVGQGFGEPLTQLELIRLVKNIH